jgi:hypothetical protein
MFSCRLYQREVARLDLEILHYVYDNTGPGSKLRELFTHISAYYGNQDIFAQTMKDMPPVFHVDYAAQQADRAQKLKDMVSIYAWDLTTFFLPEVVVNYDEKKLVNVKIETDDEAALEATKDCTGNDRSTKRRRVGK